MEMFCCILSLFYYIIFGFIALFVGLLSALIISEQLRKWFFAKLSTSQYLKEWERNLFLKHRLVWLKEFSQFDKGTQEEKLKILEVGVGGGANFEHYPANCKMTVLDFNENFKDEFMKNIKIHPNIEFDEYLTGNVEDMHQIDDNSFDVVLITFLFCSVNDVPKALQEVKRVMKKGGKYFFMEHVSHNKDSLMNRLWSLVQDVLTPLWTVIMCGCHLNRKTWLLIQEAGFKSVKINHSWPENVPGLFRHQIWGCATK